MRSFQGLLADRPSDFITQMNCDCLSHSQHTLLETSINRPKVIDGIATERWSSAKFHQLIRVDDLERIQSALSVFCHAGFSISAIETHPPWAQARALAQALWTKEDCFSPFCESHRFYARIGESWTHGQLLSSQGRVTVE